MTRRSDIAKINIARQQLRMHEDDYRALLNDKVGKDSLRAMTDDELQKVVVAMKAKGFKTTNPNRISKKSYVRLIFALWKSCHQKGVVTDGSKKALRRFVGNRADVSDPNFLNYDQAQPIIEALKAMEKRAKGELA